MIYNKLDSTTDSHPGDVPREVVGGGSRGPFPTYRPTLADVFFRPARRSDESSQAQGGCGRDCGAGFRVRGREAGTRGTSVTIQFTVWGSPRTKKTSNQVVTRGRVRVLPSKAWTTWVKTAPILRGTNRDEPVIQVFSVADELYNICAIFYRDARRGDAVGYYQRLADLLEKRGVISNDKFFVSWDGSRLEIDRKYPRVEIVLTACPA